MAPLCHHLKNHSGTFIFKSEEADPPSELTSIKEITVLWGSNLTIPCSYQPSSSYSENRQKWTIMQFTGEKSIFSRHGDESTISLLEYRGRVSVPDISTVGNVSLTLTKVTLEDRGDYICEVDLRSKDGQITPLSAHTKIIILRVPVSKPVITNVKSPHTIFEGEALRMYCTTSGSPPVKYRWYKKKSDSFEQVMEFIDSLSRRHATLSDSGEYYCTAENKAPEVINRKSDPVLVTVLAKERTTTSIMSLLNPTSAWHETTSRNFEDESKVLTTTSSSSSSSFSFSSSVDKTSADPAQYDVNSKVSETDMSTIKDAVTVYPSSSRASIITTQYNVTSQVFEMDGTTDKAHLRSSLATVIFITLISAVALAVLISLAICIYMRKKKGKKKFGYNSAPLDNVTELKNLKI
ncbi:Fc receptor-like protein 5 [Erpetoichthys calabaricus]|uniref:Fc receptor-like protein 5 n=1 Tax=Erpetoichthys calabaricus TaxID=27687 RepID=UPI002234CB51|nr:Fc receptor-like protein 5 [Erpetoichthys calabaricus]